MQLLLSEDWPADVKEDIILVILKYKEVTTVYYIPLIIEHDGKVPKEQGNFKPYVITWVNPNAWADQPGYQELQRLCSELDHPHIALLA